MPVVAHLELETRAHHRDADHPWLSLLSSTMTRARYIDLLARAFGFEQPLEAALAYTPQLSSLIERRRRCRLLAHDLFTLDYGALAAIPRCWIAPFPSPVEALGWLFAVERSARLYAMVCGNLIACAPELAGASTYLNDGMAPVRWRELGGALERFARTPDVEDQVAASAHTAFRALRTWYQPPRSALLQSA